jgi:hypothetical protein
MRISKARLFATLKLLTYIVIFIVVASFTAYGQTKISTIESKQAIQNIKFVFDDYVKYQESTDSEVDKDLMTSSLKSLDKVTDLAELEVLINVWMYYDPTDFPRMPEIDRILKVSRPQSIEAVKKRIADKYEWENEETAPYSDLKNLLKRLDVE